jgi:hypothetical protein
MYSSNIDEFSSTTELAREFGYSRTHVVLLCDTGRIEAKKSGKIWIVYKPSMKKYIESLQHRRNVVLGRIAI